MPTNPRIEDLKKRMEREPGSRLFAQLAEELRKAGELMDAIRVAREGLQKHPTYATARMTLGRALLDFGDLQSARNEFAAVLRSAADNILAGRFLAECEEGLGNLEAAAARYRATLQLAPGDRQLSARLQVVEEQARRVAEAARPLPAVTALPSSEFEASFEPPPEPPEPRPIPLVDADETFELERPYDAQGHYWVPGQTVPSGPAAPPADAPPVAAPTRADVLAPAIPPAADAPAGSSSAPAGSGQPSGAPATGLEFGVPAFDYTPQEPAAPPAPSPAEEARPPIAPLPPLAPPLASEADGGASSSSAAPPAPPLDAPIASPTLAELYFDQGLHERAADVYREVLVREPGNERARARLAEIEALEKYLRAEEDLMRSRRVTAPANGSASPPPPVPPPVPPVSLEADDAARARRRAALQRSIDRLEGLLAAIKRG